MTSITVLLAGPTDPSKEIEEVLLSWGEAGFLRPFLWVPRTSLEQTPLADVTARRCRAGAAEDVSLLDELARWNVAVVRLVSAHLVVSSEGDPALVDAAEALGRRLLQKLAATQELQRLNIVVPAEHVTELDPGVVRNPDVQHVVVSCEDRRSDRSSSRQIRWPDELYGAHAALNIATLCGLWWATDPAPLQRQHAAGSAERSQVVVTRSFARVLTAPGLVRGLTGEVFERRRTEAWTAAAVGAVNAPNAVQVSQEVAQQLLDRHQDTLSYRSADEHPREPQRTVRVLKAFKDMALYIVRRLREAPGQIVERVAEHVRTAVEQFAQQATFGGNSFMTVSFGGRAAASTGRLPAELTADYAASLLRDLGRSSAPAATAELWAAFRRVSFSLIDGGLMPDGIAEPKDGARRLVVKELDVVVPRPEDAFAWDTQESAPPPGLPRWAYDPIAPWDVGRLRQLRDLLRAKRDGLGSAAAPTDLEREMGPEAPPALSDDDPAEVHPPQDDAGDVADRVVDALAQVEDYAVGHNHTLMWRVGNQLAEAMESAGRAFGRALGIVRAGPPTTDDRDRKLAAKWLHRRWLAVAAVALAIPLVSWYLDGDEAWETVGAPVIAAAVLTWIVGWLVSFIRYQRRIFQITYEHDEAHRSYSNAIIAAGHAASEIVRLSSLYEQYVDWAEIIARIIHHPEGQQTADEPVVRPQPASMPLAMRVAEGLPSKDTLQQTSAKVGRSVFRRGWLSNLYQEMAARSADRLKARRGLGPDDATPDADRDLAHPAPRTVIRDDIAAGEHAGDLYEKVHAGVMTALGNVDPDSLFATVRAPAADEQPPNALSFFAEVMPDPAVTSAFLQDMWQHRAQVEDRSIHKVAKRTVWGPHQLLPKGAAATNLVLHDVVASKEESEEAFVLAVVRCDVSQGSPAADLRVFGPTEEGDNLPSPIDPNGIG